MILYLVPVAVDYAENRVVSRLPLLQLLNAFAEVILGLTSLLYAFC